MEIAVKASIACALLALCSYVATAAQQDIGHLSDDEVHLAIGAGRTAKNTNGFIWCSSQTFQGRVIGNFGLCVSGPFGRVALKAFNAKREYRDLAASDISEEERLLTWSVVASPFKPTFSSGSWNVVPPAKEIIIQPRGQKDAPVVRAVKSQPLPESWSNAFGAKFEGQGMAAEFDQAAIPPAVDVDFVVLTEGKEFRYTLTMKDRSAQVK
jgi:hypothetical protein